MFPDLSYFFHWLFGTARDNGFSVVKTFGMLLGLAFLSAGVVMYKELKRKEKQGLIHPKTVKVWVGKGANIWDIISNSLIGFVLGFKIPHIISNFENFKSDAPGVLFSKSGNIALGLLASFIFGLYVYWTGHKKKLKDPILENQIIHPYNKVGDIVIYAAISGILGARLFSILENLDTFFQDPLGQLFSGSGLTVYGGFILGFACVYWYVKRLGVKPIHVMDAAGMSMMLAYGVGRLGCQLSGDGDWGIVNTASKPSWFVFPDWMWAYSYPNNVLNQGIKITDCIGNYCSQLDPPVFPTPIYETIACVGLFFILWFLRKRISTPGVLFYLACVFMGIERFLIETIRVNPRYDFLGFNWSQAQYISVAILLIGIAGIFYQRNKYKST